MVIGDRLRSLREEKKFSQGEIEKRTGLLRCYISRVENGHTVPAIETLEKMARALEIPLYQIFHEGDDEPQVLKVAQTNTAKLSVKDTRVLSRLAVSLRRMKDRDKTILLGVAKKLAAAR